METVKQRDCEIVPPVQTLADELMEMGRDKEMETP